MLTDNPAGFCVLKSAFPSNESSMTIKFITQSKRNQKYKELTTTCNSTFPSSFPWRFETYNSTIKIYWRTLIQCDNFCVMVKIALKGIIRPAQLNYYTFEVWGVSIGNCYKPGEDRSSSYIVITQSWTENFILLRI
jgi:hypothetical protein